jgi:hypothetical protein
VIAQTITTAIASVIQMIVMTAPRRAAQPGRFSSGHVPAPGTRRQWRAPV